MVYRQWEISELGSDGLLYATLGEEMLVMATKKEIMDAIDELEDNYFLNEEDIYSV